MIEHEETAPNSASGGLDWKNLFKKRATRHCSRLPREGVESPSLVVIYEMDVWMWHLQTWFSNGFVLLGRLLELMILKIFPNLNDSMCNSKLNGALCPLDIT